MKCIFSKWILDSLFSGILDSKSWILDSRAQYFGFHKQKFPGFQNPDYLRWGELSATTQSRKKNFPRSQILEECINSFLLRLFYLHLSRLKSQIGDSLLLPNGEIPETFLHDGVIVFLLSESYIPWSLRYCLLFSVIFSDSSLLLFLMPSSSFLSYFFPWSLA